MTINPIALQKHRSSNQRRDDPDETEGRALYRAYANAEASMQMGLSRRVRLIDDA